MNRETLDSYQYEAEADAEALAPYQPDMLEEAGVEYRGGTDAARAAIREAVSGMTEQEMRNYKSRMLAQISDCEAIVWELNKYI